jgi:SAM-dependent methyltransferase
MRPELYHTHHKNYIEDLPYWITLADQTDGPILELGCGTGRVILPFYQEGFRIFGLDYDLQMLAYLKQQAPALPVFAADLTRFHLGMKFSFILLTCNTYSTLSSVQRKTALQCIDHHLRKGGLFAASLPNPYDLNEMGDSDEAGPEEFFTHPQTGDPIQVSSSWKTGQDTVTIYWHYDHLLPDGQVQRTTHHTTHYLDPASRYIQEMEAQGFTVQAEGEFDGTPFSEDTDFLILKGFKPA